MECVTDNVQMAKRVAYCRMIIVKRVVNLFSLHEIPTYQTHTLVSDTSSHTVTQHVLSMLHT